MNEVWKRVAHPVVKNAYYSCMRLEFCSQYSPGSSQPLLSPVPGYVVTLEGSCMCVVHANMHK